MLVAISRRRLWPWLGLGAIALLALATLGRLPSGDAATREALGHRGRVLGPTGASFMDMRLAGTWFEALERHAEVVELLQGTDGVALSRALRRAQAGALAVEPAPRSAGQDLLSRLVRYEHVAGLRGLHVSPALALYTHDVASELSASDREALLGVARGLLEGARPPRISSFPEPLRRLRHVEVMLLLRAKGRARLWRSARGSSLARALITAAGVARERWAERSQALGGALDEQLPLLTLEVSLLQDDGTLGARDPAFLQLAFKPAHGVGYEHKGAWRYLLPELMHEHGSPMEAYAALLEDNGHAPELLATSEVRLYRMAVSVLASGPGRAPEPDDGLSDVNDPDEVLPR